MGCSCMLKDFVASWLMFIGQLALIESGEPESTNNEDRAHTRLLIGLVAVGETCLILLTATIALPDRLELMIRDMPGGVTTRFVWGLLYYGSMTPIMFLHVLCHLVAVASTAILQPYGLPQDRH